MPRFTSNRERLFWILAGVVLAFILASIWLSAEFAGLLGDQRMLEHTMFWAFIVTLGVTAALGLRRKPGKAEIAGFLGVVAVFVIVYARMGVAIERSHLIEYGVLSLLIHEALKERKRNGMKMKSPALWAIGLTVAIGALDEVIQLFVPDRYFDWFDIGFDLFAACLMVLGSSFLSWIRRKVTKPKQDIS